MKNAVYYLIVLLAIAIGSCKPKKNLVKVDAKKSDTVIVKVEQVKAPFLIGDFRIEEVCDTVEVVVDGVVYKAPPKARDFDYETVIDSLKAVISLRNNAFSLNISQKDRILSEKELIVQKQKERIERLESIEKTSINLKLILGALIVGFALGYFRPWRFV